MDIEPPNNDSTMKGVPVVTTTGTTACFLGICQRCQRLHRKADLSSGTATAA